MTNKFGSLTVVILGLAVMLGCRQLTQTQTDEPKNGPETSSTFTLAGKEWTTQNLKDTDLTVSLPGNASDKSPQMPPSYKEIFSAMHIYSFDDKDFASSYTELVPTGKRSWQIKDLAETSLAALKRQIPTLTYTIDIKSESNAKYNGSFTRNGKAFDLRGCCIYKKSAPARVWAVLTLYPKDNADAQTAGQKIIDSVVLKDSTESCK